MGAYSKMIAAILSVIVGQMLLKWGLNISALGIGDEVSGLIEGGIQALTSAVFVYLAPRNRYTA